MIIYRVSGNPVKSRVSGLFPKKCPIHNSAKKLHVKNLGGEYVLSNQGTANPGSSYNFVTRWIDTGVEPVAVTFSTGAPISGGGVTGHCNIVTCSVEYDGRPGITFIRFNGGARNNHSEPVYLEGMYLVFTVFSYV